MFEDLVKWIESSCPKVKPQQVIENNKVAADVTTSDININANENNIIKCNSLYILNIKHLNIQLVK